MNIKYEKPSPVNAEHWTEVDALISLGMTPPRESRLYVRGDRSGLVVIDSILHMDKGEIGKYRHLVVLHPERMPTQNDLCQVKDDFMGTEMIAIQIIPAASKRAQWPPNCLHLYTPMGSPFLFDQVLGGLAH